MSDRAWRTREADVLTRERYALMTDRIARIPTACLVPDIYQDYFEKGAVYLLKAAEIYEKKAGGRLAARTMKECQADEAALWGHLDPARYAESWANPTYAVARLGTEAGQLLCFLCSEMECCAAYAFQGRKQELTLFFELFIQVYDCMEEGELKEARKTVSWFFQDYSALFVEDQIRGMICPDDNFFVDLTEHADLTDPRYLYQYGLPVGEQELRIAAFLNTLSDEEIAAMADTYTEGYRAGFAAAGIDLAAKRTVRIDVPIGFERMTKKAIANFRAMGLAPCMAREPASSFAGKGGRKRAVYSTPVNRQYDFDHRMDMACYLDQAFVERRLEEYQAVLSQHRDEARQYAGPAVVEVFGETPFSPEAKAEAFSYNEEQQALRVRLASELGQITDTYIPGGETSYTIIAWPTPDIGARFEEIFAQTLALNTLDSPTYQRMQQCLIDAMDGAREVRVTGRGENRTDLTVGIRPLADPEKETAFENCVADVNIPVGEVFTSPVLSGTNGTLHVTDVYLEGLRYRDLTLTFQNGRITSYTCSNFPSEEENQNYIRDNILMHHETLPMGEFAIGTNTLAYRMARHYGIGDRMPILIAEKTGPHFAVGDTCYSHEEELVRVNPDGKRIVAVDNEQSALRDTDPLAAYFNCHTDITIPYDEIGAITAVYPDGSTVDVIRDGRFLVPGTEELNVPLQEEADG